MRFVVTRVDHSSFVSVPDFGALDPHVTLSLSPIDAAGKLTGDPWQFRTTEACAWGAGDVVELRQVGTASVLGSRG